LDKRRTPILPQDFIDVGPEAIFLGHGHGDHPDNAAYLAKWTGATIYASPETCDVMQQDVTRMWNDPNLHNSGAKIIPNGDPVNCVGAVPRNSPPGEYSGTVANPTGGTTTVRRITQFDPNICIMTFKHVHSGTAPVDPSFQHAVFSNLGDPRYAGAVTSSPTVTTYPAMFPTGTPFTPPANATLRVPGQINATTTGFGGSAGNHRDLLPFRGPRRGTQLHLLFRQFRGTREGRHRHRLARPDLAGAILMIRSTTDPRSRLPRKSARACSRS